MIPICCVVALLSLFASAWYCAPCSDVGWWPCAPLACIYLPLVLGHEQYWLPAAAVSSLLLALRTRRRYQRHAALCALARQRPEALR